jgi:hypothetical protein
MPYSHRQQREIFHFLFLERLLKIADPRLFVLKGGVNLRFFFNSPRYSEDMDLDVSTTTQRFRARLVTSAGDAHPTKVEFSRRAVAHPFVTETIDPAVARPYRRLAFACQHYPAQSAVLQKVAALVHRAELQAPTTGTIEDKCWSISIPSM